MDHRLHTNMDLHQLVMAHLHPHRLKVANPSGEHNLLQRVPLGLGSNRRNSKDGRRTATLYKRSLDTQFRLFKDKGKAMYPLPLSRLHLLQCRLAQLEVQRIGFS